MRSIIVAFPNMDTANKIRSVLVRHGLPVAFVATNGSMALRATSPDMGGGLVICAPQFHDMTAINLFSSLQDDYDMLMFVPSMNMDGFDHRDGMFFLQLPIRENELVSSVRMLLETRQMYNNPIKAKKVAPKDPCSPETHKRTQEEQKLIDQAKRILINQNQMSEQEAHRFLQKRSMDTGSRLIDTAMTVIRAQEF